jgi:transposase
MDNARFHRKKVLEETARKNEQNIIFLPPYSPDFSPIERKWGNAKRYLRKTVSKHATSQNASLIAERIVFIEKQRARVDERLDLLMTDINSPITTIPGIGNVLGATILGEIGDVSCFATPEKAACLCRRGAFYISVR